LVKGNIVPDMREGSSMPLESVPANGVAAMRDELEQLVRYRIGKPFSDATASDILIALSLAVRQRLIAGLLVTREAHARHRPKRIHYLSMEFLMGQSLLNNLHNLRIYDAARDAVAACGFDLVEIAAAEHDAALGNGGLGRLAACFVDSMASLDYAGYGHGIKYEFGLFRQEILDHQQREKPDYWHSAYSPWLVERQDDECVIPLYGRIEHGLDADGKYNPMWLDWKVLIGVPNDMPIVGFGGRTVNSLRLYEARSSDSFDMEIFNTGDYLRAVEQKIASETVSKVLYPSDSIQAGKELRLIQEYFLVACSLRDILRLFRAEEDDIARLPDRVAIQMNDTHPALAVAELMRILIDEYALGWATAWDLTVRTLAYTNHTLMPEALEKWEVRLIERVLPRHMQIIYEINHQFLAEVAAAFPGDAAILGRMSLIEEGPERHVRMAHLAIVGSHSVNGVAELHSHLVKHDLVPDFYALTPAKFGNKTNGVTPRRWMLQSNPALSGLLTDVAGSDWITDLDCLRKIEKNIKSKAFRVAIGEAKQVNKRRIAERIWKEQRLRIDTTTLFDVQCKRMHEYKRQLLNALHLIHLYLRIVDDGADIVPRTHLIAGKAAPGYYMAKLIIQLICRVADTVNRDKRVRDRLKIVFVPDYKVSLSEVLIPAADLSEQISTAGTEASGTGNMKFAMNGALTIGTLDGANIEIMEEVGKENFYVFGLTTEEVLHRRANGLHRPEEIYRGHPALRRVLDSLRSTRFAPDADLFAPIFHSLTGGGDHYMLLADFDAYEKAHQAAAADFRDADEWNRRAALNIARMGKFSSDRTIRDYARDIWHAEPVR
jgi:starch phosphorylase